MANPRRVPVDVDALSPFILLGNTVAYEWTDGKRTDRVTGDAYEVAAKGFKYANFRINTPHSAALLFPEGVEIPEDTIVVFDNLKVEAYPSGNGLALSGTADGCRVASASDMAGVVKKENGDAKKQ